MTMMNPDEPRRRNDLALVNNTCDALEAENGAKLSMTGRRLFASILTAVVEDPSTLWIDEKPQRAALTKKLRAEIRPLLVEFYRSYSSGSRLADYFRGTSSETVHLSTFEVLHWLSNNLERICPFRKGPEKRR